MFFSVLLTIAAIVFVFVAIYCGTQLHGEQAIATCIIMLVVAFIFLGVGYAAFVRVNTHSNAQWQVRELRGMGFSQVRYDSASDTASGSLSGELAGCQVSLYYDSSYDEDTDESSSSWLLDTPPGDRLKPVTSAMEVTKRPEVVRWCSQTKK